MCIKLTGLTLLASVVEAVHTATGTEEIDMSKSYKFTDEHAAYVAKMAKTRGLSEEEAAQNLMDKGISRDKALNKYSGGKVATPKAKGKATPKAKAAPKAKAKAAPKAKAKVVTRGRPSQKAAPKKARAKISAPKESAELNGSFEDESMEESAEL